MRAIAAFSGRVAKPALKSSRRRPCVASRKRHRELGVIGPWIISLVLPVLTAFVFLPVSGMAQTSPAAPRIRTPVDEAVLTTLRGNTHPLARPEFDQGAAPPALPMDRMLLVLKRSPEQELALQTMLDQQHDKSSANYHRWLTPDEFGQQFGPADQDIQAITSWLQSHGFQVVRVGRGRTAIEFSGTAAQVRDAFRTEIHSYLVGGAQHWANGSDPQIPAALAPVVSGVAALNNFPIRPLLHVAGAFSKSAATGEVKPISAPSGSANSAAARPQFTLSDSSYALGPADFGTIYNVLPLWKGNPVIDGTGQSIAIVGQSNINLQDVRDFRSMFVLPANDPQVILNGPDPGLVPDGSETEALLDTEWSGAIAPGAKIIFITSATTNTDSGADLSALYAVDNDVSPVLSVSFGLCELFLGTTGNQFHSALWEQAAAEGITVVVATGDSGSAGCDFFSGFSPQPAQFGLAVSGWASTPFNVAVGGTDFLNFGPSFSVNSPSPYWNASNSSQGLSAKGYVPESTWNSTCTDQGFASPSLGFESSAEARCNDPALESLVVTDGGSGGRSNCTTSDGVDVPTCSIGYPRPSWQAVANDTVRDLPDISLFASDGFWGSFYIVCEADALPVPSSCNLNHGLANFIGVGGTSAAAPTFAAIMALVNQYTGSAGQGNANYELYKLASLPSQTALNCNSTTGPASGCVFNDVTFGTIAMPCAAGSTPDCTVSLGGDMYGVLSGYDAKAGYDLATGLGSVNAFNLVQNWGQVTFNSTTTTLSLDKTSITHGQSVTASVTVSDQSGEQPSGDVSLIATSVNGQGVDSHTLSGATANSSRATWSTSRLPGSGSGSYNVHAHYPGDGTFGGSDSPTIAVTVNPEASTTTLSPLTTTSDGNFISLVSPLSYGTPIYLRADVRSAAHPNSDTAPTGSVTFADAYGGAQTGPVVVPNTPYKLNSKGTAIAGNGLCALSPGPHSVTVSYSGDNSYLQSGPASAPSFTITPATPQVIVLPPQVVAAVNSTFELTVLVGENNGLVPLTGSCFPALPSGTITLFDGTTQVGSSPIPSGLTGTTEPGQAVALITVSASALPFGQSSITAAYSGDSNYVKSTSSAIPADVGYATSTVLTSSNSAAPVSANVTFTAQVTSSQSGGPAITGNVLFRVEDRAGTLVPLTNGIAQFTTSFAVPSFPEVNAEYSGDQNYIPSRASLREGVHDFTLSDNLGSSSIVIGAPGQSSAPVTLTISGTSGYTGTIAFSPSSCVIMPAGSLSSCSFSPSSVSGSGSTQLMINTTSPRAAGTLTGHFVLHGTKLQPIAVCLLFLLTLTLFNKQRRFSVVFGSVILLALFGLWACGGSSNATTSTNTSPGTPTGVPYTVTINAAPSGENSHTINLAFIVQ